ncbi:MAG: arginase family protein [Pseudomonadota bacterium]
MDYPDWKETREGMWAAHLNFPMFDDETPSFMARPIATTKDDLEGADVVVIGSPYVSSSSDEWAGIGKEHWLAAPQRVRQQSIRYQSGYVQDFRLNVFDHLNVVDYGDADIPPEANVGKLDPELILKAQAAVESKVNDALDVGALPVVIGQNSPCGSYAIAKCVAEHTTGNVGVVSLDTHWDIFRLCPQTKDPRIAGGFCWLYKTLEFHDNIHARNLVEIGPRGMLEASDVVEELIDRGAAFYSGWDVRQQGVEAVCKGLDHAYNGTQAVYGHFDMDVLGGAGPAPGDILGELAEPIGLTDYECIRIAHELGLRGVDGFSFICIPPGSPVMYRVIVYIIMYLLAGKAMSVRRNV